MQEPTEPPIAWMEVLETGIPEIDDDHRELIDQCNELGQAIAAGAWPDVVAAAQQLADRCAEHFRAEEALLDQTEFPRRERHKLQHREIERRFKDLVAMLASVDGSQVEHRNAARAMRLTLVDILFRHDLDYKSHLQHVAGR